MTGLAAVLCPALLCNLFLSGCGTVSKAAGAQETDFSGSGTRSNTPKVLVPEAPGTDTETADGVTVDFSNISSGYFCVLYSGSNTRPKIGITAPDGDKYYFMLHNTGSYETFPLTGGDGAYQYVVYENLSDDQYVAILSGQRDAAISDPLTPYLYPNQYVDFTADTRAVAKGAELVKSADGDLAAVGLVYDYCYKNISYDYNKADTVESGYTPDVDETLESGKGICFDYAALMACMLRSQGIPTRLEVGYAGTVYHAWISTYIKDVGWINGIIQFNGSGWTLIDPTTASVKGEKEARKFISSNSYYQTKYIY